MVKCSVVNRQNSQNEFGYRRFLYSLILFCAMTPYFTLFSPLFFWCVQNYSDFICTLTILDRYFMTIFVFTKDNQFVHLLVS